VPGAPQVFDAALLISTALFFPSRLRAISAVEMQVERLSDVNLGVHRYGGIGFFFRGKELSHIHGNGLLDCFVGRTNRDLLLRESGGVMAHHVFPRSGWISFFVKRPSDVERALELIQIACVYREKTERISRVLREYCPASRRAAGERIVGGVTRGPWRFPRCRSDLRMKNESAMGQEIPGFAPRWGAQKSSV